MSVPAQTRPSADPFADVPPYVRAWIRQLLQPELVRLLSDAEERQVEVRLIANRGRVRRRPAILLDSGPMDMADPGDVS